MKRLDTDLDIFTFLTAMSDPSVTATALGSSTVPSANCRVDALPADGASPALAGVTPASLAASASASGTEVVGVAGAATVVAGGCNGKVVEEV